MSRRKTSELNRVRCALAVLLFACAASVAQAFYLINPLSYWPASSVSGNITFQVGLVASPPNVPNPPLMDGNTSWDNAFVEQMNAWNAILPDAVLNLAAVPGSAAIPAEGNNVNNVFFSGTIYGDSWGSSTAGICLAFWSGNERTEADILFNSTKTWNSYTGNLQGNLTDFRRVALHELGHALLLDHPDDVGQSVSAIMNGTSTNVDALTADDTAAVLAVFGALTPVTITEQPLPMVANSGGSASINVTATGSEPITYQWQRSTNGGASFSNVGGLTFPNGSLGVNSGNNGEQFRVVVTNPVGSVTSRAVTLTITAATAPTLTAHPASTSVNFGGDVILTVHATGSPAPDYYWEMSTNGGTSWGPVFSSFGSTDVTGAGLPPSSPNPYSAGSPTLKISHAIAQINGYQFRAVAINGSGSVTSNAATLTVTGGGPAAYFTWQPLDVYAQAAANVMIVAGTSGSPPPSRQWQRSTNGGTSWSNLSNDATFSGVATSTLTITGVTTAMTGHLFRLNISNSGGSATSRTVTLSVGTAAAAPTITDAPDDVTVPAGQSTAFSTAVTSFPAPVFQWEFSADGTTYTPLSDGAILAGTTLLGTAASGSNSRALALANVSASLDGYRFRLVARNASGNTTSAAATLTIGASGTAPSFTTHPSDSTKVVGENATFTVAASGSPAPTLQWQRNTGSGWNNLSNDPTFSGVTTTTLTVTGVTLAMNGHQFRALASNSVQADVASNAATLAVGSATTPGQPSTPTATATAYDSFTAQWSAVSGATAYRLDVATDAGFTSFVSGYQNLSVSGTSQAVTGLRLGTYYVRVRASNTAGTSPSSSSTTVTVGSRLVNLSTRGQTSTGSPMIAGFYVSGAPKTLLIRAVANRLADLGVPGTLPDPRLRLVNNDTQTDLATNDDWNALDPKVIAATNASGAGLTLVPGSKDSVIVAENLAPGTGYSAVVETVTGAPGLVLVELYETDEVGRLINISTRGLTVSGGADIMIPGTFFEPTSKRILIRVVGETLGQFVSGALVDPILEVYDQDNPQTPILTNDDWDPNDTALVATWTNGSPTQVSGLSFANGSRDSAVLVVLPQNNGGYTIQAKGKNGASGTVLVELYEVP